MVYAVAFIESTSTECDPVAAGGQNGPITIEADTAMAALQAAIKASPALTTMARLCGGGPVEVAALVRKVGPLPAMVQRFNLKLTPTAS